MEDRDRLGQDAAGNGLGREDLKEIAEVWTARSIEALLFGAGPLYPSFRLRAVAFVGKDERRAVPPSEGEYVVDAEERAEILAAFRAVFNEDSKTLPTEEDDGCHLSGVASVEALSAIKAWNGAAGAVYERLKRSAAVRNAEKAIEALGFLYLEVVEEGAEDVVARALSAEDRNG